MDKFDQEKTDSEMAAKFVEKEPLSRGVEDKNPRNAEFIADLCFDRGQGNGFGRYKRIGRIFHDFDHNKTSILLSGFRFGRLIAKPYKHINERKPFIAGDIEIPIPAGAGKKLYQWIGFAYTDQVGNDDTFYNVVLDVDPWPLIMARRLRQMETRLKANEETHTLNGMWLYISHREQERERESQ